MVIPKDELDQIRLWTLEGRKSREVAELLHDKYTERQIVGIKNRYGIRYRNPNAEYKYVAKIVVKEGHCKACGADLSYACPVPRCSQYDGGVEDAPRTLAGVSHIW